MQRRTLRWIIGLMGVAMIGLIAFQLYWIDSLLTANEERFKKDVLEALNAVSDKLERQETFATLQKLDYINRSIAQQERQNRRFTPNPTTSGRQGNMEIRQQGGQQLFVFADTLQQGSFELVVNFSSFAENFFFEELAQEPETELGQLLERQDMKIQQLESQLAKVSRKYELTFEVMRDLMGPTRSITSRFNPQQLDSLLQYELDGKGIDIAYNYGIIQPKQSRFLLISDHQKSKELSGSELKARS